MWLCAELYMTAGFLLFSLGFIFMSCLLRYGSLDGPIVDSAARE